MIRSGRHSLPMRRFCLKPWTQRTASIFLRISGAPSTSVSGGLVAKRVVLRSCVFIFLAALASAAQTITGFNPQQAAQGSAFTLTITGTGFSTPAFLQFSPGTGIAISNVSVFSTSLITAQVQIASNAPLGPQSFFIQFRNGTVKAPNPFNITTATPAAVPPTLTSVVPVLVT